MAFSKYDPVKSSGLHDFTTSHDICKQLWQELTAIRHLNRPKGINAKRQIAPWIDQAKTYFLDGYASHWKSAGLLYYYSFLNLAKAFLVAKRQQKIDTLRSTSAYHGLTSRPQTATNIIDFEVSIHPPTSSNGQLNIFSSFYEALTKEKWPFNDPIQVTLGSFIGYSKEITVELFNFYGINQDMWQLQSLYRIDQGQRWFEVNAPDPAIPLIQNQIQNLNFIVIPFNSMTQADRYDWLIAHERTAQSLQRTSFLRTPSVDNQTQQARQLQISINVNFQKNFSPYPVSKPSIPYWLYIPNISLHNTSFPWHPLLSDYLVSFILSTILRYQPHLLNGETQDAFLAEAWCNQSAITALRYYLMELTTPSIRLN